MREPATPRRRPLVASYFSNQMTKPLSTLVGGAASVHWVAMTRAFAPAGHPLRVLPRSTAPLTTTLFWVASEAPALSEETTALAGLNDRPMKQYVPVAGCVMFAAVSPRVPSGKPVSAMLSRSAPFGWTRANAVAVPAGPV